MNSNPKPFRWAVGITTAPRTPATLTDSLLSLRDAGWPSATVFADSGMQLGPYRNLRRAASELFRSPGVWNAFLILQDDVRLSRGLRDYLDASVEFHQFMSDGRAGVVSLYCAGPNSIAGRGWHTIDNVPHLAYGALAYVFSRPALRAFLKWSESCPTPKAPADYLVGCFCRDSQLDYFTHTPSFVRHTGEVSSLPNPGGVPSCRQCKEFLEVAKTSIA